MMSETLSQYSVVGLWRARSPSGAEALTAALLNRGRVRVGALEGATRFSVNAVIDKSHRLSIARGPFEVDVITQIGCASSQQAKAIIRSNGYRDFIREFEPLGSVGSVPVEQRVLLWPPENERHLLLKRMSILQRAPEFSAEEFQRTWKDDHGPRVASHNGKLLGYFQDAVIADPSLPKSSVQEFDGITELWFKNAEDMNAVLPEKSMSAVTANAAKIIGSITTFLIKEVQVF